MEQLNIRFFFGIYLFSHPMLFAARVNTYTKVQSCVRIPQTKIKWKHMARINKNNVLIPLWTRYCCYRAMISTVTVTARRRWHRQLIAAFLYAPYPYTYARAVCFGYICVCVECSYAACFVINFDEYEHIRNVLEVCILMNVCHRHSRFLFSLCLFLYPSRR